MGGSCFMWTIQDLIGGIVVTAIALLFGLAFALSWIGGRMAKRDRKPKTDH